MSSCIFHHIHNTPRLFLANMHKKIRILVCRFFSENTIGIKETIYRPSQQLFRYTGIPFTNTDFVTFPPFNTRFLSNSSAVSQIHGMSIWIVVSGGDRYFAILTSLMLNNAICSGTCIPSSLSACKTPTASVSLAIQSAVGNFPFFTSFLASR